MTNQKSSSPRAKSPPATLLPAVSCSRLALSSRLTLLVGLACLAALLAGPADSNEKHCYTGSGRQALVRHVIDGDTVELTSGKRVRIIGINAPEIYHRDNREQPFASSSRNKVLEIIRGPLNRDTDKPHKVTLIAGEEKVDQHGRLLYHLISQDGKNTALALVSAGLAVQSAVSPNTHCANRYKLAEEDARKHRRGLWKKPGFWLSRKRTLPKSTKGFRIVTSRVTKQKVFTTKQSKNSPNKRGKFIKLSLANGSSVFASLPMQLPYSDLTGKKIEVRGWFYTQRGKPAVTLHHPANLHILE